MYYVSFDLHERTVRARNTKEAAIAHALNLAVEIAHFADKDVLDSIETALKEKMEWSDDEGSVNIVIHEQPNKRREVHYVWREELPYGIGTILQSPLSQEITFETAEAARQWKHTNYPAATWKLCKLFLEVV